MGRHGTISVVGGGIVGPFAVLCLAIGCGGGRPPIQVAGPAEVFRGIVTSVEGSAPVSEGEACELRVEPTDDPLFNCRVEVRCGEEVLYGFPGAGFNRCAVADGDFIGARDEYQTRTDGDPALGWSRTRGLVVVLDSEPDSEVAISMAGQ